MTRAGIVFVAVIAAAGAFGQEGTPSLPAADGWQSIGKTGRVCGQVVDADWPQTSPHAPTYLYLERPRPEQVFTVVLPFAEREVFGDQPEKALLGKRLCVTGKIEADHTAGGEADRKRRARVVVEDEEQMVVE